MLRTIRTCDVYGTEGAMPFVFQDFSKPPAYPGTRELEYPFTKIDLGHMALRELFGVLFEFCMRHETARATICEMVNKTIEEMVSKGRRMGAIPGLDASVTAERGQCTTN